MATDYFLKIDGIEGESQDSKHKNEIHLESWSWGEQQMGTHSAGGGGGAGKVSMNDFSFAMKVNKASPKLLLSCASGAHTARTPAHATARSIAALAKIIGSPSRRKVAA